MATMNPEFAKMTQKEHIKIKELVDESPSSLGSKKMKVDMVFSSRVAGAME